MTHGFLQRVDNHQSGQRLANRHRTGAELLGKLAQAHNLARREGPRHQATAQALENHFLDLSANPGHNGHWRIFLDILIN
jgi:hypothetical protein